MSNFEVLNAGNGRIVKTWTKGVPVEPAAQEQLITVAGMPFIFKHVAAMPDVHVGIGATIGSVIATQGAVMPSSVGVDIGCGMVAAKTSIIYNPDDHAWMLHELRRAIERNIPHGRSNEGQQGDRGAWGAPSATIIETWDQHLVRGYERIVTTQPKLRKKFNNLLQLGTLGTGNHFVEVCVDTENVIWVMLHSGSRGIGASIGGFYMKAAQEFCAKHFIDLPNRDLAYLVEGTPLFGEYMFAVDWAQKYAWQSRLLMLNATMKAIGESWLSSEHEIIAHCHHNYVDKEHHFGQDVWVTRKGAVRARVGDMGIIPGSMGAKSFIVEGLGNPESFTSCSHGAGRKMSRTEAFRKFSLEDHEAATAGVECRKDREVLDETPGAYKSIDDVMAAQSDLVQVKAVLKQIVCVKG